MQLTYWRCTRCCAAFHTPRIPGQSKKCHACGAYYPAEAPTPLFPEPAPVYRHMRQYNNVWHSWETQELYQRFLADNTNLAVMVPGSAENAYYPGGYLHMRVVGCDLVLEASKDVQAYTCCSSHAEAVGLMWDLVELSPFVYEEVRDAWKFSEVAHAR